MVQVFIYGLEKELNPIKKELSEIIHMCIVDIFQIPRDKRFHRFFPLKKENFFFPSNRSEHYTIIEIMMFEGRSVETKKNLIKILFKKIEEELAISPNDIEIVMLESPKYNWGIRGQSGDDLKLDYKTDL